MSGGNRRELGKRPVEEAERAPVPNWEVETIFPGDRILLEGACSPTLFDFLHDGLYCARKVRNLPLEFDSWRGGVDSSAGRIVKESLITLAKKRGHSLRDGSRCSSRGLRIARWLAFDFHGTKPYRKHGASKKCSPVSVANGFAV